MALYVQHRRHETTQPRPVPKGPRLTVDAQRVDGVDKLLVHLHGPHDPGLLRTVALAVAVLTALPLCTMSDRASAPDDLCLWWLAADAERKVGRQQLFLDGISVTEVSAHPLITLPLFVVTLSCLIVMILLRVFADCLFSATLPVKSTLRYEPSAPCTAVVSVSVGDRPL